MNEENDILGLQDYDDNKIEFWERDVTGNVEDVFVKDTKKESKKEKKVKEPKEKKEKKKKIKEPKEPKESFKERIPKIKELMKLDIKDVKSKMNDVKKTKSKYKKREQKKLVVALDIGSENIKIVEGMFYKGELTVNKFAKMKTPLNTIHEGAIVERDLLFTRLSKALKMNEITAKDAIITNNSSSIINREMTIPLVKEEELETVVKFEIQQYLPINLDDYIIQISILKERHDEHKMDVRVIAYPEKTAKEYYDLLKDLDLKPYALDVNYNAVSKMWSNLESINGLKYNPKSTIAFVDIGANNLDVDICSQGVLKFTRITKTGGAQIDKILMNKYGVQTHEMIKYKEEKISLKTEKSDSQDREIIMEINDWVEKIEKILQFYKTQNSGMSIEKIFIHGGSSKLEGLDEYMSAKLYINTEKIEKIKKINVKGKKVDYKVEDFVNAIGSIIRL